MTILRNAKIVLKDKIVEGDIFIKNHLIHEIGKDLEHEGAEVIDCTNKYILPGLIDLHCFVTDPGFDYKDSLKTLTQACLKGGFTTILAQPTTNPFLDNKMAVEYVRNKLVSESVIDIKVSGSLTSDRDGDEKIAELNEMKSAGVSAYSDCNKSISNINLLNNILKYCTILDLPVFLSSINKNITGDRFIVEGATATLIGADPIPKEAQDLALGANVILSKTKDLKVHINNITSRTALDIYRATQRVSENYTASVSAHYTALNEEKLASFDTVYKIIPCLRSEDDRLAVIEAIKDGTIDCITSGHRPETASSKNRHLTSASYGVSTIETAFLVAYNTLVLENDLDFVKFIRLFTYNPAKVLRIEKKGQIKVGNIADLVIFDENDSYTVEAKKFASKAKYSMFEGETFKGRIQTVFVRGTRFEV